MSYYARPSGDYSTYGYAGDPGWLSSLWRGVKKFALPVIGGMIAGPAGSAIGGMLGGGRDVTRTPPIMPMAFGGAPIPGSLGGAVTFPGGTRVSLAGTLPAHAQQLGAHAPQGYHLRKQEIKPRQSPIQPWVRNRRMNIANPRALRRAMRRAQGFEKMAKRVINFNKRVRPKGRS